MVKLKVERILDAQEFTQEELMDEVYMKEKVEIALEMLGEQWSEPSIASFLDRYLVKD